MTAPAPQAFGIECFLAEEQSKDLLRFTTAGSVDDGKSTLIGRLLYDSKSVYEDQIHAVRKASANRPAGELDLSLLTDGLRAEREQGITIDVAYRYFATPRRKFIIADAPGHEQYTRNMATGASTADLAIILIDARNGVQPQSRRHAYIASLLGIPRIVAAVNKMDLVAYAEDVFRAIEREFRGVLSKLGVNDAWFTPISALEGDNVVRPSGAMPWFQGPSLLEYLETVPLDVAAHDFFRFPVQYVIRPDQDFRGYAGQIAAGSVRPGDAVTAWPSGWRSRVRSIETFDGPLAEANAPMSVALTLEDELDIGRGDLLAGGPGAPHIARAFTARAVWMHADPLAPGRTYLLKHAARTVPASVRSVRRRVDIHTFEEHPASGLALNEIGVLEVETTRPLFFDAYARSRGTGSAILIDPDANATVAALMIEAPLDESRGPRARFEQAFAPVTAADRISRFGHGAAAVSLGLRRAAAERLERLLFEHGSNVAVFSNWGEAEREAAKRAGLIAVVVGGAGSALPSPGPLPEDDDLAARRALDWLGETGVLARADLWSGGAGI